MFSISKRKDEIHCQFLSFSVVKVEQVFEPSFYLCMDIFFGENFFSRRIIFTRRQIDLALTVKVDLHLIAHPTTKTGLSF